jgi:hypothetical protein
MQRITLAEVYIADDRGLAMLFFASNTGKKQCTATVMARGKWRAITSPFIHVERLEKVYLQNNRRRRNVLKPAMPSVWG